MKYVRLAFIEKNVDHVDRIYYAWLSTCICQLWLTWIIKTPVDELDFSQSQLFAANPFKRRRKSKKRFFITDPAYFVGLKCSAF